MNKRLLHEIRHVRLYLAALGFFAIMTGLLIVVQATMLAHMITGVFLNGQTLSQITSLALILLIVLLGRTFLVWGNGAVAAQAAAAVKTSVRRRLFGHIQALGPIALKQERSGELTTTMVEGVEALDAFFSQLLPQVCAAVLIPFIIGVAIFFTDMLSGAILLITTPLLLFFLFLVGTLARSHTKKQWRQLSVMSAHFLDVLQGLTTLKMLGRSHRQQETIASISNCFRETTMKVLRVAFLSSLVLEFGTTLSTALVAVEIGLRLLYNQLSFPSAFLILLLVPDFYLPLRTLSIRFHAGMNSVASAQRIYELLDTPIAATKQLQPALLDDALEGYRQRQALPTIQMQHVTYTYHDKEGQEHPALRNISLTLERGQKVALVGASGAGKTTIAHLLLRFIEPQQGHILVGTSPMVTILPEMWRRQIAWVPQRPFLFHESIADNIRMGCKDATMDQIKQAAQQAHLHDFIQTLPYGYETIIGERGARLSGGQAQRLALARAFLKDASLFILDEATAHLDKESEEAVQEALRILLRDRMALVITHHLHTLRIVDRVVLLDEGRIVAYPLVALLVGVGMWFFFGAFDPILALIFTGCYLLSALGIPLLTYWLSQRPGQQLIEARSALQSRLVDHLQGLADTLAFGQEDHAMRQLYGLEQRYNQAQQSLAQITAVQESVGTLFMHGSSLMILLFSIQLVRSGQINSVFLALLVLAALSSFEAVLPLPSALQYLSSSLTAARRLFALIDASPALHDPKQPVPLPELHDLVLEHVRFRYNDDEPYVLQDVNLSVREGACVAVTGPSGAGKSTIINLLQRFWDYQEGHILLGGQELRNYHQDDIRSLISVVSQDAHLFHTTIRQNLLLAREDANEEEMIQAARQAHIHDFIVDLPRGYDTEIGEQGLRLSGGERQRLAIARALLKNAPILLLDEPTAHLDAITGHEIRQTLRELIATHTTLLITHHLADLEMVDEVVVLNDGRLIRSFSKGS